MKETAHAAAIQKEYDEKRAKGRAEMDRRRALERPQVLKDANDRITKGSPLEARFKAALEGNFKDFPPRTYETLLPGLRTIGVHASPDGKELRLILIPEADRPVTKDYPGYYKMKLTADGELVGSIPDDLAQGGLTEELIKDELVFIAENLKLGFWIFKSINESQPLGEESAETVGSDENRERIDREELERLAFLNSLNGSVFGVIITSARGFDDYNAVFLQNGTAILDNKKVGNAAYVFKGLPEITPTLSRTQKDEYFEKHFRARLEGGKKAARAAGATRITHQAADWKEAVLNALP